ncbi:hypothetical protein HYH02_005590 [Chlamydomonas schloesseri]|uniref:PAS domain-containing protein n=1 Tax=Chlamydomonas schloesseri TaxID=2026947 RepID=A0A835WKN2_9CHLO|nr:hypothetical protein HYH02_005590 [Chlamydomonas schloesseri]|eukprot:KAG2449443.1 hypothetical protein HYH02_005590 [Chlamydomonas schloesseri]
MNRAYSRGSLLSNEQYSDAGSSTAGSTASRRGAALPLKDALDGDDREDDDVATTSQAVELAVFGVLYTLSKEKVDGSRIVATLKMVLDFLQQLVVLLSPGYGWYPWVEEWTSKMTWLWEGLSYLDFQSKLSTMNYGVYMAFMYAIGALLAISLCLCAYVGYCFKRHKFTQVWPVWALRVVVSVFFQTFYVSAMGIFLNVINCHWLAPAGSEHRRGYMDLYPDTYCLGFPAIVNLILAIILVIVFSTVVFVTTAADFELSPLAEGLLAAAHPHVELINLGAKTVFLLASAILVVDIPKLQALIFAAAMGVQFYTTVRWVPALTGWVNHLRAGFNLALTWVSIMMVVLKFNPASSDKPLSHAAYDITFIALVGIPGFCIGGLAVCWLRLTLFTRKALAAYRKAASDAKPKDTYAFLDIYEVEMASRVCRTPGRESGTQDEASVKLAERILKAGITLFPISAFAHILYSNLLIEVQTLYQAGQSQLMAAKKQSPGYVEKFAIFVREQQHMQRAHTSTTGESAVDLVSYVEFQRNYRLLARATQRALTTQQAFWRLLLHSQVHFRHLTRAFNNIEEAQDNATKTYRMVLDRYPNSVKLLRSYARFQEEVMNNPWRASQIYEKADKLEEQQSAAHDNVLFNSDHKAMLTQVDDKTSAVVVINASGIIQMTNKTLQKMYGYRGSELEGQNVSILMPAPFSTRHNGYIAAYLATGQAKILDSVRQVIGLHRRRYMFPVRLAVTRLSGQGQDSTFMGILAPVEAVAHSIGVWCLTTGLTLTVDQRFQDMFGIPPGEVIGRTFKSLLVEQDDLQTQLNAALALSEEELAASPITLRGVHVMHKYAGPVQVDVSIQRGGTADEPLHMLQLQPQSMTAPPLIVFNRSGSVVFASSSMSELLGYTPRSLALLNAEALMPTHYQMLHHGGLRDLMQRKSAHSCRSGQTVFMAASNKALVPVRLSINHKAEGEDNLLTVVEVTKSSIEAGLEERRLKLEVSPSGEILSVSPCSPALFGLVPDQLLGNYLFKLFPDLVAAAEGGAGGGSDEDLEEVLEALRLMSMERLAPVYIRTKMGSSHLDGLGSVAGFPPSGWGGADRAASLRMEARAGDQPSTAGAGAAGSGHPAAYGTGETAAAAAAAGTFRFSGRTPAAAVAGLSRHGTAPGEAAAAAATHSGGDGGGESAADTGNWRVSVTATLTTNEEVSGVQDETSVMLATSNAIGTTSIAPASGVDGASGGEAAAPQAPRSPAPGAAEIAQAPGPSGLGSSAGVEPISDGDAEPLPPAFGSQPSPQSAPQVRGMSNDSGVTVVPVEIHAAGAAAEGAMGTGRAASRAGSALARPGPLAARERERLLRYDSGSAAAADVAQERSSAPAASAKGGVTALRTMASPSLAASSSIGGGVGSGAVPMASPAAAAGAGGGDDGDELRTPMLAGFHSVRHVRQRFGPGAAHSMASSRPPPILLTRTGSITADFRDFEAANQSGPGSPLPRGAFSSAAGGSSMPGVTTPAPAALGSLRAFGSGTPSTFNAIAAAALARSRLAAKAGRLQRQGGMHFGLPPRPVILEIDGTSGDANLVVSIWHPDKVASVLEVSREGDIRQAVLDELHPPGPTFGLSATSLMQFNIRDVLCIPPHVSVMDFLFNPEKASVNAARQAAGAPAGAGATAGGMVSTGQLMLGGSGADVAKRHGARPGGGTVGVLKTGRDIRKNRNPGPLLHITCRHADGRPLLLAIQALPKKTSASSLFIRAHLLTKVNTAEVTQAAAFSAVLGALCGPGTLTRMPAQAQAPTPAAAPVASGGVGTAISPAAHAAAVPATAAAAPVAGKDAAAAVGQPLLSEGSMPRAAEITAVLGSGGRGSITAAAAAMSHGEPSGAAGTGAGGMRSAESGGTAESPRAAATVRRPKASLGQHIPRPSRRSLDMELAENRRAVAAGETATPAAGATVSRVRDSIDQGATSLMEWHRLPLPPARDGADSTGGGAAELAAAGTDASGARAAAQLPSGAWDAAYNNGLFAPAITPAATTAMARAVSRRGSVTNPYSVAAADGAPALPQAGTLPTAAGASDPPVARASHRSSSRRRASALGGGAARTASSTGLLRTSSSAQRRAAQVQAQSQQQQQQQHPLADIASDGEEDVPSGLSSPQTIESDDLSGDADDPLYLERMEALATLGPAADEDAAAAGGVCVRLGPDGMPESDSPRGRSYTGMGLPSQPPRFAGVGGGGGGGRHWRGSVASGGGGSLTHGGGTGDDMVHERGSSIYHPGGRGGARHSVMSSASRGAGGHSPMGTDVGHHQHTGDGMRRAGGDGAGARRGQAGGGGGSPGQAGLADAIQQMLAPAAPPAPLSMLPPSGGMNGLQDGGLSGGGFTSASIMVAGVGADGGRKGRGSGGMGPGGSGTNTHIRMGSPPDDRALVERSGGSQAFRRDFTSTWIAHQHHHHHHQHQQQMQTPYPQPQQPYGGMGVPRGLGHVANGYSGVSSPAAGGLGMGSFTAGNLRRPSIGNANLYRDMRMAAAAGAAGGGRPPIGYGDGGGGSSCSVAARQPSVGGHLLIAHGGNGGGGGGYAASEAAASAHGGGSFIHAHGGHNHGPPSGAVHGLVRGGTSNFVSGDALAATSAMAAATAAGLDPVQVQLQMQISGNVNGPGGGGGMDGSYPQAAMAAAGGGGGASGYSPYGGPYGGEPYNVGGGGGGGPVMGVVGVEMEVGSELESSYLGTANTQEQDPQRQTDFQRGRRLRRISKVLERPAARNAINTFWSHSKLMALLLITSHLACAISILVLLSQLSTCVLDMDQSGITLEFLHRAAINTRVLHLLHTNRTQPPLYDQPDMAAFEASLKSSTDDFESRHVSGFNHAGTNGALRYLWEDQMWEVSLLVDANSSTYSSAYMSLFDLGKQFVDAARDVQTNHRYYTGNLTQRLADVASFRFIHEEAVWHLTQGYVQMLDTLVLTCVDKANLINRVMLALLVVEACCICGAACVYLSWRLMQVTQYRCSLFTVFLAIPSATIKALASRQINAGDGGDGDTEDLSDDGEPANKGGGRSGGGGGAQSGGRGGRPMDRISFATPTRPGAGMSFIPASVPMQYIATGYLPAGAPGGYSKLSHAASGSMPMAAGTAAGGGGAGMGGGGGGGAASGALVPTGRRASFLGGVNGGLRSGAFSDAFRQGDSFVHGGFVGVTGASGPAAAAEQQQPQQLQQPPRARLGRVTLANDVVIMPGGGGGGSGRRPIGSSGSGSVPNTGGAAVAAGARGPRVARVTYVDAYGTGSSDGESSASAASGQQGAALKSAVSKTGATLAGWGRSLKSKAAEGGRALRSRASHFFRRKSKMAGTHKVLVTHSLQNWWLVLPIVLWAILITTCYAISYSLLSMIYEPTETLNVANFNVWRVSRLTYFAHELCALEDGRLIPQYKEWLADRRLVGEIEWEVLLYGSKRLNETISANISGIFHRIGESGGIARAGGRIQQLLFQTSQCLRANASSCFPVGHPYFAATHQGMSTVMRNMLRAADLLLADPPASVNTSNANIGFLFQVGLNDAHDGMVQLRDHYEDLLMGQINQVRAIHIGLLVASFVLIIVFVFYLVRPFVKYTKEEAKHVAKLLSELGTDVDVEKLVENALGATKPAAQSSPSQGGGAGAGAGGGAGAGVTGGVAKASMGSNRVAAY